MNQFRTIDTILFDLDGTLLNTLDDLADSLNHALQTMGFPLKEKQQIKSYIGNGIENAVSLVVPDGRKNPVFPACFACFKEHYLGNMQNKTDVYPGIRELLHTLAAKGYRMGVVSNKFDQGAKELVHQYFGDLIQVTIGEIPGTPRKPAPDSVLRAISELGSWPERSVYIGDSEPDVLTARNAGIPFIGVTWGFRDREVLEREGAEQIIDRPEELLPLL